MTRAGAFGLWVVGWVAAGSALAQQSTDSGTITLQATVSGYVDIASGGPATLTGASGGAITGKTTKGGLLTGLTLNLGDISPLNTNAFVRATVPLRLRSNVTYSLTISATDFTNAADPLAIQPADVGFGIDNISRADNGVNTAGVDTPDAACVGDPSLDPDADPTTARWDYRPQKSLAYLVTPRKVLGGDRIMRAVPASLIGGLTLNTFFAVKPQFFSPGSFTTQVTFTVSTP